MFKYCEKKLTRICKTVFYKRLNSLIMISLQQTISTVIIIMITMFYIVRFNRKLYISIHHYVPYFVFRIIGKALINFKTLFR